MPPDDRVSVVVLTHNRSAELQRTLQRLVALPEQPPIVVVDNGSGDGTPAMVQARFPQVALVRESNRGAAGRNAGVARVRTPYVAFCDDDTWWAPGALVRAADLLDAHPRVGAVAARVLVGAGARIDPTCEVMAGSPLDATGLPGPALISIMAGATVMRVQAYREAGGYEARLFLGGEELLLGLDLATCGWHMVYAPDVVTHHHPSPAREATRRRLLHARNRLWIAGLRLPLSEAWRDAADALRGLQPPRLRLRALARALAGLPWVLARRRVVPAHVAQMYRLVTADMRQRERATKRPMARTTGGWP